MTKQYQLNENDLFKLVEKTLNDLFRALAFKDIRLDVGDSQLPITAEIKLNVDNDTLKFHIKMLPRVDIQVSHYAETPEEIQHAVNTRIGYKTRNNGAGK